MAESLILVFVLGFFLISVGKRSSTPRRRRLFDVTGWGIVWATLLTPVLFGLVWWIFFGEGTA